MKSSYLRQKYVLVTLILTGGLVLTGCKKETPTTEQTPTTKQPSTPRTTAQDQTDAEKEKEFVSDRDVVTCKFEKTTTDALDISENGRPSFIRSRKTVKQAELTLAGRPFKILVGGNLIREFFLYDVEKEFGPYWWGAWSAHSYHKIDDGFFEFMVIDDGTKIAARTYKGDVGVIKVGKGDRNVEKAEFSGSVKQASSVSVSAPIGETRERTLSAVTECQIPVGDYTADYLSVKYDNLSISISDNYHTNAQGQSSNDKKTVYGMKVRKDEPFVLDFSNEQVVIFDEPSRSTTSFSRGTEIKFAAVLVDPELDVMVRRLYDLQGNDGERVSLDPKVVITRADGEIVGEGVMPFG